MGNAITEHGFSLFFPRLTLRTAPLQAVSLPVTPAPLLLVTPVEHAFQVDTFQITASPQAFK